MSSILSADTRPRLRANITSDVRRGLQSSMFWLPVSEAVNRGGRFVLMVMLAREVGTTVYGGWLLAAAIGMILTSSGDLGLATVITRRLAIDPQLTRGHSANILGTALALLAVAGGALAIVAMVSGASTFGAVVVLLGLGGMSECLALLMLSPLRTLGRLRPEGFMRAAQGPAVLAAGALLLTMGLGPTAIAVAFAAMGCVSAALACAVLLRTVGIVRPKLDLPVLGSLLRESLPLFIAVVTVLVYFRLDSFLIAAIQGKDETGVYGAAFNVAFGLLFVPAMVGRVLLPRLSRVDAGDLGAAFQRGVRTMAIVAAATTVLLVLMTPLVTRMYGAQFAGVGTVYVILIAAQGLYCGTHLMYTTLLARGRAGEVWAFTTLALGLNIGANLMLIPLLGANGAAVAAVASEGLLLGAQAPFVLRLVASRPHHETAEMRAAVERASAA